MGCKARVASTLVPAEFTLAAVREKFNDRCLCWHLFLFPLYVKTIPSVSEFQRRLQ